MAPFDQNPKDPLHGITLETILKQMVKRHGWGGLARSTPVRCYMFNPTIKSSLTFLRRTPWARKRLEDWFISEFTKQGRKPPEVPKKPQQPY